MSDNLNNQIKTALFAADLVVTTSGGDITPTVIQPAQISGQEKYNLDQRDDLSVLLYSVLGTVVAGVVITVNYYSRITNSISDTKLLATEAKTLAEITVGNHIVTAFSNAALAYADYFTIGIVLKEAVGASYTVTGQVIVKKKSDLETAFLTGGTENGLIYVDGNRTDAYNEDGSVLYPFKTISALITALNTDYASLSNKQLSTYDVTVAKGSYSLTGLVIPTYKLLRFHGTGVVFTGNFAITQSPIGGSGEDPYTRIEFVGNSGFRGEKGQSFQISGNVTCTRTNDSLTNLAFVGCRVSGNWLFDSDGTWVLQADHNRFSGTISSGTFTDPESAVLIESDAFSRFSGVINIKGCLYRCNNTEFSANVTCDSNFSAMDANPLYMPYRITNCVFSNTANSFIGNQNIVIDSSSYKSLLATTETITFSGLGALIDMESLKASVITSVFVSPADLKSGTAPAYQSYVISSFPHIVKKFLNATTNTAYFDIKLPKIATASTIRYRVYYIITEATAPAAAETSIFTFPDSATVTKTYAAGEAQNNLHVTEWTNAVAQSLNGLLTVTGTYAQNIGIQYVEIEYTKE